MRAEDKPMKCPRCDGFESKDRQQLFRHMISKHKVLDQYLQDGIDKMRAEGKQPFGAAANPPTASFAAMVSSSSSPSFSAVSASLTPTIPAPPTPSSSSFDPPALAVGSTPSSLIVKPVGPQSETLVVPPPLVVPSSSSSSSATTIVLQPQPTSSGTTIIKTEQDQAAPDKPASANDTNQVTLAEFIESSEKKNDTIMQVDGSDSCSGSECGDDDLIMQVDGAGDDTEDTDSLGLSVDPGDDDSEFSMEDQKGSRDRSSRMACPLCKEEMKFSKTYHFATTHFRPRLQRVLPTKKPFVCPDCGEEQQHKINLWSHYIGRAHKHLETWLEEYQKAEVKPDWCDPSPANPRANRRLGSSSTASVASPRSPMVTSSLASVSSPSVPVEKPNPCRQPP